MVEVTQTLLYFAYGSNMSSRRLKAANRVPSAIAKGVAKIQGYRLTFDKVSGKNESGKCDAEVTDSRADIVYGVLYEIPTEQKKRLDKAEGLHHGYAEKELPVFFDKSEVNAIMYYATRKNPILQPFHWYKEHVIRGAEEFNLPPDYIGRIREVVSQADPNRDRELDELSIYLP